MNTRSEGAKQVRLATVSLFKAMCILGLAAPSATAQVRTPSFVDSAAAHRIVVTLDPSSRVSRDSTISAGGRMLRAVRVTRFHVEPVVPATTVKPWTVTVLSGTARDERLLTMAELSADAPSIQVPRPYGVRIDANDSLLFVATVRTSDGEAPPAMRVTIEYEAADEAVSRLGVVSISASERSVTPSEERVWTWEPTVGGRMVGITGHSLAGAEALVLQDATTGEVLWSLQAQTFGGGLTEDRQRETIRPSVALLAGRTYRLAARFAATLALRRLAERQAPPAMLVLARR